MMNAASTVGWLLMSTALSMPVYAETLVLWGNDRKAPKIYLDSQTNGAKGILVDIAELIFLQTGDQVVFKLSPWARAFAEAKSAEQNVGIIGIKKTTERETLFDFSEPIYDDVNYLIALKSSHLQLRKLEDLKGLSVSYNRGAYYGPEFEIAKQHFSDAADSNNEIRLRRLLLGRIDAAMLGGPGRVGLDMVVNAHEDLKSNADKFVVIPIEFKNPDHIAFAKGSGSEKYLEKINKAIRKLKSSGAFEKVVEKYQVQ
ncbi:MAG: transporter substrate-binding domain-containing protein [Motiliproteus sp.]